jgi:hypothetical protein
MLWVETSLQKLMLRPVSRSQADRAIPVRSGKINYFSGHINYFYRRSKKIETQTYTLAAIFNSHRETSINLKAVRNGLRTDPNPV